MLKAGEDVGRSPEGHLGVIGGYCFVPWERFYTLKACRAQTLAIFRRSPAFESQLVEQQNMNQALYWLLAEHPVP